MVAHRKVVTLDRLRRDARRGIYDEDAVEDVGLNPEGLEPTELEKILNRSAEDSYSSDLWSTEHARAKVLVHECWLKTDIDGDGVLEDAIVTVCGDRLLRAVENPYGRAPFFDLVPFWDSYQVWGRMGLGEVIQDVQDAHTALLRQMVVSLGLSNQWRAVVDETLINLEDLISDAMFIRSSGTPQNAFMPMPHPGMNPQNFQFFEYLKSQLEEWTPIPRYNQGLDASSLNKTASGINMIMSAAQQRQEEIIRNFAETGISELFRFLIQINQRYLDQEQVVRLQNETISFAPDDLAGDFDLSVDSTAGLGARELKAQAPQRYLREMFGAAMQIGAAGPEQFVMAGQKLLRLMGIEDAERYLAMPQPQEMPGLSGGMEGMDGVGGPGAGAALPPVAGGRPGTDMPGGGGPVP